MPQKNRHLHKGIVPHNFFSLLSIYSHLWFPLLLLITGKVMLTITPLYWLVAEDIIFDTNAGGKTTKNKWLHKWNLSYFSYFKYFIGLGYQSFCPLTLSGGLQCPTMLGVKATCLQSLARHFICRYYSWCQI